MQCIQSISTSCGSDFPFVSDVSSAFPKKIFGLLIATFAIFFYIFLAFDLEL
jgi:hypothetical protein